MTTRKHRARGALPANWTFRSGRPRWHPGPALRAAGWKGRDLKDAGGAYLSEGASIDLARAINEAVAAWRAGELVPAAYADVAPPGACVSPTATKAEILDRRSIGRLLDAYLKSREFTGGLGLKTQMEYRSKLNRLVDVLAGYAVQPEGLNKGPKNGLKQRADASARPKKDEASIVAYTAARAAVKALSIDVLEPPPYGAPGKPPLYTAYWKMRDKVGHAMANGTLRVASAWLDWCLTIERAVRLNAAKLVDMQTVPGRLRVGTWDELAALIKAAETLGMASIGDAIVLGVDLSWNQGDRLALTWAQISAENRVRGTRRKTGRVGETRLLAPLGARRLAAIRARQEGRYGPGVTHTHVIVCEATGAPWKGDHYRHKFALVRAEAAKHCPSVATLNDQDLRDTAVTVAYEAGLTEPEIASRTLHSLKRIREILDQHYGEISRTVGDNGAAKLEAYLADKKVML